MTAEEELRLLELELAAAEAELEAANAVVELVKAGDIKAAPKSRARTPKPKAAKGRARTPVHHPESDLRHSIEGYGGPIGGFGNRLRANDEPVVTKHIDPTRPRAEYVGRECLLLAAITEEINLGTEPDVAAVLALRSLPADGCKCVDCGKYN